MALNSLRRDITIRLSMIVVFLFPLLGGSAFGEQSTQIDPNKETTISETVQLHECQDERIGIKFFCHPDWELETQEDVLFIIINQEPAVTLTIAKSDDEIMFMEQLTNEVLQTMGQYGVGFTTQMLKISGQEAIQVDGYSEEYPEIRVRDYYLTYNMKLYSILFSVNPRDKWMDYQELFEQIIKSVQII